jgi:bifunctional N-acetylglucosamine-1-phosphate-uridyltransferase/glucosamine-1-phosphate-acetyltransferase GlmU-like protein
VFDINKFISKFPELIDSKRFSNPWEVVLHLKEIVSEIIETLDDTYVVLDGVAVHISATIENGAILKGPMIIMEDCLISANTYFREGALLGKEVKIGPGCEIKGSIVCSHAAMAHLNYIGNSIIGQYVNFEAGSIAANHYNERMSKRIKVKINGKIMDTGLDKFGAIVGDHSKIGANAVLSPGTILAKKAIVSRLELVDQVGMDSSTEQN